MDLIGLTDKDQEENKCISLVNYLGISNSNGGIPLKEMIDKRI